MWAPTGLNVQKSARLLDKAGLCRSDMAISDCVYSFFNSMAVWMSIAPLDLPKKRYSSGSIASFLRLSARISDELSSSSVIVVSGVALSALRRAEATVLIGSSEKELGSTQCWVRGLGSAGGCSNSQLSFSSAVLSCWSTVSSGHSYKGQSRSRLKLTRGTHPPE